MVIETIKDKFELDVPFGHSIYTSQGLFDAIIQWELGNYLVPKYPCLGELGN